MAKGGGGVYVCDHNVIALGNLVIATRCISLLSLSQKPQRKKTRLFQHNYRKALFGHIEFFLDVVYNIALIV